MSTNSHSSQHHWVHSFPVSTHSSKDIPTCTGQHGDTTLRTGSSTRSMRGGDIRRGRLQGGEADKDKQQPLTPDNSTLGKSPSEVSFHSRLTRKQSRDSRERPWTRSSRRKPAPAGVVTSETHYEVCLPKEQWMNMRPMTYAKNPKWGQAYQIKKHPDTKKPFKPQAEQWLIENDFRIWLFEKTRSDKLELAFAPNGPFVMNVKNVKGRRRVDKIGAHRELYEQFHSERLRKEKERISTLTVQRYVRGWLVRNKIKKLQKEAELFHGVSWKTFTKYYKRLMSRIQRRNGVERPETRFDLDQVKRFLKKKYKYEKVFHKVATSDRVTCDQMQSFFNACGLQPSDSDMEDVFKTVFRGCCSTAEVLVMIDCSSGLTFPQTKLQQEFLKELFGSLDMSKHGIRLAIVPFNCKNMEFCGLGDFNTKEDILLAIESMELEPGNYHCSSSIHYMTDLLSTMARTGAPKRCILVTNGNAKVTKAAEREAKVAKEKDINMIVVGLGGSGENKDLLSLASSPDHLFRLTDLYVLNDLTKDVIGKLCLNHCTYCKSISREDDPFHYQVYDQQSKKIMDVKIQHNNSSKESNLRGGHRNIGRGLLKPELMELLWTLYPPEAAGLPLRHKSTSMRPVVDAQQFAEVTGCKDSDFDKCLEFVLKSKLDKEGTLLMPVGEDGVEEVTDYKTAIKYAQDYLDNSYNKQ